MRTETPGSAASLRAPRASEGLLLALLLSALSVGCTQLEGQDGAESSLGSLTGGDPTPFSVTAYCTGTVTKSGARVRAGMAAADPKILPLGSTVLVEGQGPPYDGVYTVMDTGSAVKGRILDLYLRDCEEAKEFGRREMTVTVIRHGWNPSATPVATSGQSDGGHSDDDEVRDDERDDRTRREGSRNPKGSAP